MSKLFKNSNSDISTNAPIWLMRQAGRYLPEYRSLRSQQNSFLDLCYNSKIAFEISMQPIKRFDFDAAIVFSDILLLPNALGLSLEFITGEGPRLSPIKPSQIAALKNIDTGKILAKLNPTLETINLLRSHLLLEKDVIGFCGAPWTVASYMIAGKSTSDQAPARIFAMQHKTEFLNLLDILAELSAQYLKEQIKAGASVIQIFDSWAGVLSPSELQEYCIAPTAKIIAIIKASFPQIPIIAFPKGINDSVLLNYINKTKVDAISVDWRASFETLQQLQKKTTIQGNLDPLCLAAGGIALEKAIDKILVNLAKKNFIFNLGHGILPQTPLENVEFLVNKVRNFKIC